MNICPPRKRPEKKEQGWRCERETVGPRHSRQHHHDLPPKCVNLASTMHAASTTRVTTTALRSHHLVPLYRRPAPVTSVADVDQPNNNQTRRLKQAGGNVILTAGRTTLLFCDTFWRVVLFSPDSWERVL